MFFFFLMSALSCNATRSNYDYEVCSPSYEYKDSYKDSREDINVTAARTRQVFEARERRVRGDSILLQCATITRDHLRRNQNQCNVPNEDNVGQETFQGKTQRFYRYSKLIVLSCCWLLFTVRKKDARRSRIPTSARGETHSLRCSAMCCR